MRKIIRMFSVLKVFTHTAKNESIVNLYQKELLGCLSEDINVWPSHNECHWHTSNWSLFNIYEDSMGLNTNDNSQMFGVHFSRQNIRTKRLLKLRLWVCKVRAIMDLLL